MSFKDLPIQKPELKKLYQDLGEQKIRQIIRVFYEAMEKDAMIGFFFTGRNLVSIADKQTEFLMRAMGVLSSYNGKPPAAAHQDLPPILTGHFDRRLKILESVLKQNGLNQRQIETWIGFENAFREAVIKS